MLPVPEAQPALSLVSLEWSPAGTARTLLALTSLHRMVAWTRPPPSKGSTAPVPLNRWQPSTLFTAPTDTVHAQWLAPPSLLQWAPHTAQGTDKGILQRFATPGNGAPTASLSWLRTGMHCIATITSQGSLQVGHLLYASTSPHYYTLSVVPCQHTLLAQVHTLHFDLTAGAPAWMSGPCIPLALEAHVLRADAQWQDANTLAVVLALHSGNGEVSVVTVQGDPTTGSPAVQAISSMPMGDKQKLQAVTFLPASRGNVFAVVMADGTDTEYLQVATYTSVDATTGTCVDLQSAGSVHLPTTTASDWRGVYAGDGSCMAVAVPSDQGWAVHVLDPRTVAVQHVVQAGGAVAALAVSPNGTLLALGSKGACSHLIHLLAFSCAVVGALMCLGSVCIRRLVPRHTAPALIGPKQRRCDVRPGEPSPVEHGS